MPSTKERGFKPSGIRRKSADFELADPKFRDQIGETYRLRAVSGPDRLSHTNLMNIRYCTECLILQMHQTTELRVRMSHMANLMHPSPLALTLTRQRPDPRSEHLTSQLGENRPTANTNPLRDNCLIQASWKATRNQGAMSHRLYARQLPMNGSLAYVMGTDSPFDQSKSYTETRARWED